MFKKDSSSSTGVESVISHGVIIKGEISAEGSVRIDGQVEGRISVKGNLYLGEKGFLKGDIKGSNLYLGGKVEGTVEAVQRIEITATGAVLGDVSSKIFVIEEGGVFEGKSTMLKTKELTVPNNEPVKK